ncbi:MAG TPA: SDR family oxidoreductase [Pseudonocardiaceae bacterium]|jgi:NAD(P)-dependent dehydrogenase (short-subunit alcohol dehydrogenase family)|nr:SDR family oxidoreductase [Pseudonocardiaceae bacterium]
MGLLAGKTAVVTGGSAGIGLAISERFVAEGASVFVTGRRQSELDSAVAGIGSAAVGIRGDATVPADLDRLYQRVRENGSGIDVLVANVGYGEPAALADVTDEHLDRIFGVNVVATLKTVQKALPLLNDDASVILLSSVRASDGKEGLSVYSASKAAVRSFARTWANELKHRNIRVNALAPGSTRTVAFSSFDGEDLAAKRAAEIPLGRLSTPREQASAALFLASGESSFITGTELAVGGGVHQF